MAMSLGVTLMVHIYLNLFALPEHLHMLSNKLLNAKLLKQDYRYHKLRKAFYKFYRRHFEFDKKISCQSEKTYETRNFKSIQIWHNFRKSLKIQTSLIF